MHHVGDTIDTLDRTILRSQVRQWIDDKSHLSDTQANRLPQGNPLAWIAKQAESESVIFDWAETALPNYEIFHGLSGFKIQEIQSGLLDGATRYYLFRENIRQANLAAL